MMDVNKFHTFEGRLSFVGIGFHWSPPQASQQHTRGRGQQKSRKINADSCRPREAGSIAPRKADSRTHNPIRTCGTLGTGNPQKGKRFLMMRLMTFRVCTC